MAELCREFEISRKTGYKFLKRFEHLGVVGLLDQRRVAERIPHRMAPEISAEITTLRKEHPTWGPKKLRDVLSRRRPGVRLPVVSTIGELLKREGLVTPRHRRGRDSTPYSPLSHAHAPNDVWCIDYKGQFRLRNGRYCYPLTLTDAASRYILACEGFQRISGDDVRAVLEAVFRAHGLPSAIRYDGGPPFASTGLRRLSKLSVWWLLLGIHLEQTEPASPQQNGRHERMHRTLKEETTRPPAATLLQQQERFDTFVEIFNRDRPHEAIGMMRPAELYRRSERRYPAELPRPEYPLHDLVATVSGGGHLRLPGGGRRNGQYFISNALNGQVVGLREIDDDRWLVSFLEMDLGVLDLRAKKFQPTLTIPPQSREAAAPG
jgi:transposase InsO family protein